MSEILSKCIAISMCHFLNTPYKNVPIIDMYKVDGIENKASGICHYCSVDTLKCIVDRECLRFSDVRFLNDSTEFLEVLYLIQQVLTTDRYSLGFRNMILESEELKNLEQYEQSYVGVSRESHNFEEKIYKTYTCSFSTERDSLSMWNYYASSGNGISIQFDHAWNMIEGDVPSNVNFGRILDNGIIFLGGLILYKNEDKKACLMAMFDKLQGVYEETKEDIGKYEKHILFAFKQSVNHMRCFFKNEAFACENEYRLVIKVPEDILKSEDACNDIKEKGQFLRGNVLIPYVDYKIRQESIKSIVLNPYIKEKKSIFKLGIEELLSSKNLQDVKVYYSNIPLRKYL